jgi:hypothetical protein
MLFFWDLNYTARIRSRRHRAAAGANEEHRGLLECTQNAPGAMPPTQAVT